MTVSPTASAAAIPARPDPAPSSKTVAPAIATGAGGSVSARASSAEPGHT